MPSLLYGLYTLDIDHMTGIVGFRKLSQSAHEPIESSSKLMFFVSRLLLSRFFGSQVARLFIRCRGIK